VHEAQSSFVFAVGVAKVLGLPWGTDFWCGGSKLRFSFKSF